MNIPVPSFEFAYNEPDKNFFNSLKGFLSSFGSSFKEERHSGYLRG